MFDFLKKAKNNLFVNIPVELPKFQQAIYPTYKATENAERYCTREDLYSVIRFLATTAALIPLYAYKNDKPEEVITQLLKRPNRMQPAFEFYETVHTRLLINGEAFIAKEITELGPSRGKQQLISISPAEMIVMVNNGEVIGYQHVRNGVVVRNYEQDEIVHVKYFNPLLNEYRGLSPLQVLLKTFTLSDAQSNAMIGQMQNGGVNDIVFDKVAYNDGPAVTNKRKDQFMKFIKDSANKGAPYFAAGEMQAIQLGSTLADMQVIESLKIPFKKICNVYGTSDILFNSDSSSTESNVKEMTKRTYTNTILPNIRRINNSIEYSLNLIDQGIVIKEDLSEITELQDDMNELVNSMNIAWWLTPNQKLEAMKYDRREEDAFDQPFLPMGLTPLNDYLVPQIFDQNE